MGSDRNVKTFEESGPSEVHSINLATSLLVALRLCIRATFYHNNTLERNGLNVNENIQKNVFLPPFNRASRERIWSNWPNWESMSPGVAKIKHKILQYNTMDIPWPRTQY